MACLSMALIARFPLGFASFSLAYFSKRELSSVALKRVMEKAPWDKKTRASPPSHVGLIMMTFDLQEMEFWITVSVGEKRDIRVPLGQR